MTVRLTIERQPWQEHVRSIAAAYGPALVPVVKGNGYGIGRATLHGIVTELAPPGTGKPFVAVGSVHELHDVPDGLAPVVLTPALVAPVGTRPILTVGSIDHVRALGGWRGRVMVKLASSMRRYGVHPSGLGELLGAASDAGLSIEAFALHLPLAGDDTARLAEIRAWLGQLPARVPLWVSHLGPASFAALQAEFADRVFRIRIGTALWHGVPRGDFLRLTADVLHTERVQAGAVVGYHASVVPADGTLVAIGAGTAEGISPLDTTDPDRRSPFHFARRRLTLLEGPHMHTSLALAVEAQPCPRVGDRVDVQRPLIATNADEIEWR